MKSFHVCLICIIIALQGCTYSYQCGQNHKFEKPQRMILAPNTSVSQGTSSASGTSNIKDKK